jgi:hypothetical protein
MANVTTPGGGYVVSLGSAQTGNVVTTNVAQRRFDLPATRPAVVRIVTTVGATPTCTYQIEGSADGTSFYPLASFDASGAVSPTGATFVITAAATTWRVIPVDLPWTFLRITYSANTNVTNTADVWVY